MPPPTLEALRARRDDILRITTAYGVSNVRVFGSVARGEATPESDIDLLVDYPPHFTLLALAGLVNDLEKLLAHRVDIASAAHLRTELRPHILWDVAAL
jgi:predicted nucleotidyltransferase